MSGGASACGTRAAATLYVHATHGRLGPHLWARMHVRARAACGKLCARVLHAPRAAARATRTSERRADGVALSHSAPAAVKPDAADASHSASDMDGVALPHSRVRRARSVRVLCWRRGAIAVASF